MQQGGSNPSAPVPCTVKSQAVLSCSCQDAWQGWEQSTLSQLTPSPTEDPSQQAGRGFCEAGRFIPTITPQPPMHTAASWPWERGWGEGPCWPRSGSCFSAGLSIPWQPPVGCVGIPPVCWPLSPSHQTVNICSVPSQPNLECFEYSVILRASAPQAF